MIIALYGQSCVGKTTLARALGVLLAVPIRLCGEVVRDGAKALGVGLDLLPTCEHARIDEETREWCISTADCVVEGRYLDQVLAPISGIALCEIIAAPEVRTRRWIDRLGNAQSLSTVEAHDVADEAFRVRAYGPQAKLSPAFRLDTSGRMVDDCVNELLAWQGRLRPG